MSGLYEMVYFPKRVPTDRFLFSVLRKNRCKNQSRLVTGLLLIRRFKMQESTKSSNILRKHWAARLLSIGCTTLLRPRRNCRA